MVDVWQAVDPDSEYAKSGDDVAKMDQAQMDQQYQKALAATEFAHTRRTIVKADSVDAARDLADDSFDAGGRRSGVAVWSAGTTGTIRPDPNGAWPRRSTIS
jgi:hypothetical protein